MDDEIGNTEPGREALSVDELIALLDNDPVAAAEANCPRICAAPPPVRLVAGRIEGPSHDNFAMTKETFANVHVHGLARELCLDLLTPAGA